MEYRNNFRVSLGKDHVILRVPRYSFSPIELYLKKAEEWLMHIEQQKPDIFNRYKSISCDHKNAASITILGKYDYKIMIETTEKTNSYANLDDINNELKLYIRSDIEHHEQRKYINLLTFQFIKKMFSNELEELVRSYNANFFNEKVREVKIKNNSSNWGSCSSSGNINISAKTLLLPFEHIEYVIVHELAHLKELNHSKAYWKIVESALPNYKESEKWLKENGFKFTI